MEAENNEDVFILELTSDDLAAGNEGEQLTPTEDAHGLADLQIAAEHTDESDLSEPRLPEHVALDQHYDAQDQAELRNLLSLLLSEQQARAESQQRAPRSENNEDFHPFRDCDRMLAPGSIVHVDGIPCRLLVNVPVISTTFRDDRVFVDHIIANPANFAANAPYLRKLYNRAGKELGDNPQHPEVALRQRIADLEAQIAALEPESTTEKAE